MPKPANSNFSQFRTPVAQDRRIDLYRARQILVKKTRVQVVVQFDVVAASSPRHMTA
jgi:hypothetical protein